MKKINEMEHQNNPFLKKRNIIDIKDIKTILPEGSNHGVCGSKNLGNTCFMNSSIACLSNCIELTTFFLSKKYRKYINTSNNNGLKGKLANAWYQLLKDYWKTNKTSGNPQEIKLLISKKYKKFENYEEQDANEFIVIFLELLGEDLNEIKNKKYNELKEQQTNESDLDCAKRFWDLHLSRNNSIITDLFCGLNKSIIICPLCKYKSITYNPFTSISLIIPNQIQLKNIRYNNFSKDDIFIYYIPKFSLAKTYKIKIRVDKDYSFKETLLKISKEVKEFPFEVKEFDFISVVNKQVVKIIEGNERIFEGFNFAIEKDFDKNNQMIFIPIYIKIGNNFSSYPRGLYIYEGMTYKLMKKKIYLIVRRYFHNIYSDLKKYDIDKKILQLINEYDKNEEEKLINLIGKEYQEILKDVKVNLPYSILIQQKVDSMESLILFNGEEDKIDILEKYNITSNDSKIDNLIKDLKNLINILVIQIDSKSKKYSESRGRLVDKCNVIESDDYCQDNYVNETNDKISLDDCLQLFTKKENLEKGNEWLCKRCRNNVNAIKKLQFFYLPKIFCICLSRFKKVGSDYEKNEKFVDFPINNLDMNKYVKLKDGNNYIYDIFAVCEHYGGREGGHYIAICKNIDGNWYSYDDSNCSFSSKEEVCTRHAYVLFYRRRDW